MLFPTALLRIYPGVLTPFLVFQYPEMSSTDFSLFSLKHPLFTLLAVFLILWVAVLFELLPLATFPWWSTSFTHIDWRLVFMVWPLTPETDLSCSYVSIFQTYLFCLITFYGDSYGKITLILTHVSYSENCSKQTSRVLSHIIFHS